MCYTLIGSENVSMTMMQGDNGNIKVNFSACIGIVIN